jgi:hypothetical protein
MTISEKPMIRRILLHPALAIVGTLLWGILELLALQRARLAQRR